jgi:hypothetical protein
VRVATLTSRRGVNESTTVLRSPTPGVLINVIAMYTRKVMATVTQILPTAHAVGGDTTCG